MRTLLLTASAIALLAGMAPGADAPTKDGFWSIHSVNTITSAGNAAPRTIETTISRCQDKGTPLQIPGNPPAAPECKIISRSSDGSTSSFEMQCTQNGQTTRVKETITMNGEDQSHMIMDSTFDPPINGLSGMKMVADWKYLGACPAGVKPNDAVGPDGTIIHPPKG